MDFQSQFLRGSSTTEVELSVFRLPRTATRPQREKEKWTP
jgi:hypothetical protein